MSMDIPMEGLCGLELIESMGIEGHEVKFHMALGGDWTSLSLCWLVVHVGNFHMS